MISSSASPADQQKPTREHVSTRRGNNREWSSLARRTKRQGKARQERTRHNEISERTKCLVLSSHPLSPPLPSSLHNPLPSPKHDKLSHHQLPLSSPDWPKYVLSCRVARTRTSPLCLESVSFRQRGLGPDEHAAQDTTTTCSQPRGEEANKSKARQSKAGQHATHAQDKQRHSLACAGGRGRGRGRALCRRLGVSVTSRHATSTFLLPYV